ncbi:unnamed protein product [Urochloa decumbens]|uniref:Uncharacterized protein n=1 Tax=Urochloa decumbens TaxID=240449 RepID=A0ABC9G3N4_9POAL
MASLAILLLLARLSSSIAVSSSGSYISRSAEQQVIATVAPAIVPDIDGQSAQPFLTSPSGSYAAYLRRAVDAAAGLGGDACYVQVQQAGGGDGGSLWESDCTPVGGADACDLAFSPVGLELFAGGHSLWDTGVDGDPGTLSLDDGGDMKIVSKEGVTVWTASGEPWTGQECGSPLPVSSVESVLPPPSAAGAKLVTPPSATLAGAGTTDFSSGDDQPAPPPVDTLPDLPAQPPVDTAPEQPLPPPPPADASPDLPDLPLPPPPAYTSPDSPDQPLPPPPTADMSPDQPLYPSPPPPAPATSGPDTPVTPPFGVPLAAPPTGVSPLPGTATTPGEEPGSPGGVPFSGPSPAGMPHPHGPAHPHQLPVGASPPLPDAVAPGVHGAGAGQAGVPLGHGQQPGGQGVFGQQSQLLNGGGQPLEESSGGWSRSERGSVAACMALFAGMALGFGF